MEQIVKIKAKSITSDTHDLPKTPKNIARTLCPENMNSRKIVRSRFI